MQKGASQKKAGGSPSLADFPHLKRILGNPLLVDKIMEVERP